MSYSISDITYPSYWTKGVQIAHTNGARREFPSEEEATTAVMTANGVLEHIPCEIGEQMAGLWFRRPGAEEDIPSWIGKGVALARCPAKMRRLPRQELNPGHWRLLFGEAPVEESLPQTKPKQKNLPGEILSLLGQAEDFGSQKGVAGTWFHAWNTEVPADLDKMEEFLSIEGEICVSSFRLDTGLFAKYGDRFAGVLLKGTCSHYWEGGDVWSERDYKGNRYPTRPPRVTDHDEGFLSPGMSEVSAIIVGPRCPYKEVLEAIAWELGVTFIVVTPPRRGDNW